MCIFCGTPDPSHDTMILRAAVLASGTGFILTPRRWLGQLRTAALRKLASMRRAPDHPAGDGEPPTASYLV